MRRIMVIFSWLFGVFMVFGVRERSSCGKVSIYHQQKLFILL